MSITATNHIKRRLQAGKTVMGTMVVEFRQPSVMQMLANANFDYVTIDNEHGAFNIETIADLSRTARYLGLSCLVRVPDLAYPYIAQVLDGGALGVMLPRVYTVEQVKQAVAMLKYPPQGMRGNALTRGYTNFQSGSPAEVMERVNQETMLLVQIETKEALENIDEIVSVSGVDCAFVGPNDLAISLGITGQLDSPIMHTALEKVIAACQRHRVYPGLHINNLELAKFWMEKGFKVMSVFSEVDFLTQGGLEATAVMKG